MRLAIRGSGSSTRACGRPAGEERRAGAAFFFKGWGGTNKKRAGRLLEGRTWDELPRGRGRAKTGSGRSRVWALDKELERVRQSRLLDGLLGVEEPSGKAWFHLEYEKQPRSDSAKRSFEHWVYAEARRPEEGQKRPQEPGEVLSPIEARSPASPQWPTRRSRRQTPPSGPPTRTDSGKIRQC